VAGVDIRFWVLGVGSRQTGCCVLGRDGGPVVVGVSRKRSSSRRTRPGLTTTRSAPTPRGTATSPRPCSLRLSSPPRPALNENGLKEGRTWASSTVDCVVLQRDQETLGDSHQNRPLRSARIPLVTLAQTPPNPGSAMPLPATTSPLSHIATVVLVSCVRNSSLKSRVGG